MPEVLVNGVRLFYEKTGTGPQTIVFSHSYLLGNHHFAPQIQSLKDRYCCVAYEHRGARPE
jgi:pimeloyl-ACP methyl ester carboxylesterase